MSSIRSEQVVVSVPHYIEQTVFDVSNWKLPLRVRFPHVPIFNCRRRTNCEKFGANFLYYFRGWKCSISGKTFFKNHFRAQNSFKSSFLSLKCSIMIQQGEWTKFFCWDQIKHIWVSLWNFFLRFIELIVTDIIAPETKKFTQNVIFKIFLNFIWSKFWFFECSIFMRFFEAKLSLLYVSWEYGWTCVWKGIL